MGWMKEAEGQLHDIKNNSDKMTPEDRVSYTTELQEDVAAKVEIIKANDFDKACIKHLEVLNSAAAAANKMTTHKEADVEVAALKERYDKVKLVSDEWMKKVDTLVKEWKLLDNTVNELNSWVAKDRGTEGEQQFSLEKMESTLGEL